MWGKGYENVWKCNKIRKQFNNNKSNSGNLKLNYSISVEKEAAEEKIAKDEVVLLSHIGLFEWKITNMTFGQGMSDIYIFIINKQINNLKSSHLDSGWANYTYIVGYMILFEAMMILFLWMNIIVWTIDIYI